MVFIAYCITVCVDYIDTSYEWPRLVAPPMKRHGHVIMDYCSKTGNNISGQIWIFSTPSSGGAGRSVLYRYR